MKYTQWAIYTKLLNIRNFGNYELIDNQRNLGADWTCWGWLLPSSQTESCWMEAKIKYVLVMSLVIDPFLLNLEPNQTFKNVCDSYFLWSSHSWSKSYQKKQTLFAWNFFQSMGGGVYLFIPFYIRMWLQKPIFSIALKSFFAAFSAVDLMIDKYQQVVWPFIPFMQIAGIILQARRI